jgi:hypothetical protein
VVILFRMPACPPPTAALSPLEAGSLTPREGGAGGGGVRGEGRGGPEARRGLSEATSNGELVRLGMRRGLGEAAYNGGGGKDS